MVRPGRDVRSMRLAEKWGQGWGSVRCWTYRRVDLTTTPSTPVRSIRSSLNTSGGTSHAQV